MMKLDRLARSVSDAHDIATYVTGAKMIPTIVKIKEGYYCQ
ncbi:hypothetical protein [Plantactinospora mayteni]|nr:hypothetical protein [Plantactinospora mayteni]